MRKKRVKNHVLNMRAIFNKYKLLSKIDQQKALQYFYTMVATESARLEVSEKLNEEDVSEEEVEERTSEIESYLIKANIQPVSVEAEPENHRGYL